VGKGLKFVVSGSDDTRRQWMKSTFISMPEVFFDILENFFKYLSQSLGGPSPLCIQL